MRQAPRSRRLSRRDFLGVVARVAGAGAGLAVLGCRPEAQAQVRVAGTVPATVVPTELPNTPQPTPGPLPDRAYAALLEQVAFGPRNPGSDGHAECRRYLIAEFAKAAHRVATQDFMITVEGQDLELTNIIAQHNPEASERVLLCAHWDTRPFADRDPRPELQDQPILGANDGASGVAALLEISRVLREREVNRGVDIVLFDGEDYGRTAENMFLGSRHYAQSPLVNPSARPFGILLDMVGDKDLQIYQEGFSVQYAAPVVERIWTAAATLGYESIFPTEVKYMILDDHIPLNEAGIPTPDVIDFDYPYWHTTEDTADKCSGTSLRIVSEVVLRTLDDYWSETAG